VHVQAEGFGKPLAFVITEGQRHESRAFEELMKLGKLKRDSVGRPRLKPRCLAADKAYSSHRIRAWLRRRGYGRLYPKVTTRRSTGRILTRRYIGSATAWSA
jgi:hypothetical protein